MGPAGAVLRQEPALSAILCNGVWRFVRFSGESANSRDVKFSLERTAAEGNSSGRCRHAPQWQRLRSSAVPDPVALKPHNSEADPSDTVLSCTEWNAMAAAKLHQEARKPGCDASRAAIGSGNQLCLRVPLSGYSSAISTTSMRWTVTW